MTDYSVSSGVTSTGITLNSGDTMEVLSGGTASQTTISSGALETVDSGDVDSSAALWGEQDVFGYAESATAARR